MVPQPISNRTDADREHRDGDVSDEPGPHSPATGEDARNVREARDAMQAFAFFSSAIANQMSELYDKLAHVEVATSTDEFYQRLAAVEAQREAARGEARRLRSQVDQMEREVEGMRQEFERQRVSFADHHAAKQEIARLRAEVDELRRADGAPASSPVRPRRWGLAR